MKKIIKNFILFVQNMLHKQDKIFKYFFHIFDIFLSKSIAFFQAVVYNILWSKLTVQFFDSSKRKQHRKS